VDRHSEMVKLLGTPVLPDWPDHANRVRRTLLISSLSAMVIALYPPDLSLIQIVGLQFRDIPAATLHYIILVVILYHVFYYMIYAREYYIYARIRITGSRPQHITIAKWAGNGLDYPNDPRNSSLYAWFSDQSPDLTDMIKVNKKLIDIADSVRSKPGDEYENDVKKIKEFASKINNINADIDNMCRLLESIRRFESFFWEYAAHQRARVIVIEIIVPFFMAITSIFVLIERIANIS
jgi:hypothetical protein